MQVVTRHLALFAGVLSAPALIGCDDLSLADQPESSGGQASVGGATPSGGARALGGDHANGGSTPQLQSTSNPTGGAGTGGGSSSGGSSSGGSMVAASGGLMSTGGQIAGGGLPSTGGRVAASGGLMQSGGTAAGQSGLMTSGGRLPTGGSIATSGGLVSTGGTAAVGGAQASSGGQLSSGGSIATSGGVVSTGGTAAAGGAQASSGGQLSSGGSIAASGGLASTGGTAAAGGAQSLSGGQASSGGSAAPSGGQTSVGGAVATSGGLASTGGSIAASGGSSPVQTLASGGTSTITDAGPAAWEPCVNSHVTTLAQSPVALENVFLGCSNGDLFVSFNALSANPTWLKRDVSGVGGMPDLPVNAIAYSPTDVNTVYVAFAGSKQGHKLWKTQTSGVYWLELTMVVFNEIWSLSVNPRDPLKIYAFGPGGSSMSADAGSNWTSEVSSAPMTVPIAEGSKLSTVSVQPGKPDVIWVGATNGDVFYTNDATSEQTWSKATKYMPTRAVTHLAFDNTRFPVGVFATFDGMSNDSIWVTSNNGYGWSTWQNPDLPASSVPLPGIYAYYGISINPYNSNVFYINGTYGAGMSTNGGASWSWVAD